MNEHELELRLRAAAWTLDERAPSFDLSRLPTRRARRIPRGIVIACIALAAVAAAPIAVPAIRGLFEVDEVPALGPLEYGVAPPLAVRRGACQEAAREARSRVAVLDDDSRDLGGGAEINGRRLVLRIILPVARCAPFQVFRLKTEAAEQHEVAE